MKKLHIISKSGLITLWVLCLLYQPVQAQTQDPYKGIWEGKFMKEFRTAILLDITEDARYAGKILMYSGENQIQNDEITKISIENLKLTFYIAAKETSFRGTFNEELTELSGNFIFPDNSEHPLVVKKVQKGDSAETTTMPPQEKQVRKKIPVEQLKSDFRLLIDKLKEYHPRLYSYTSEDTFNGEVSEILTSLNADLTLDEYYLEIAPLVASVKCSHTGIRLPAEYQTFIFENGNFFPLKVFVRDLKTYCIASPGDQGTDLEPGTELRSINNRPVKQIVEELLSLIPSEGNCMTSKYHELNRNFHSYFHLMDPSENFEIEFSSGGSTGSVQMKACSYDKLEHEIIGEPPVHPFSFHFENESGYGVLRVSSFGIRNMEEYFAFLDSTFLLLKSSGVTDLFVDLRDNQGGHPIFAAQLFSYLTDKEFTYFQRNPDVADFEPLYNNMQANQNHYNGNLFVLVNGACLSTTGHLISLIKYHTDAKFIGEEPGSSFYCNDFSTQLKLPNTGIEVNIPRTTFVTAVSGFDEKIPFSVDYEVDISVQDLLNNTDSYLLYLQALISENQL